ncbi:MAG TPA: hypothetical protein PLT04_00695 [Candidatus Saccharibacteria bacterium]|nr:hypothetical protein [Candidatus Saccharibacteria bacterium]
MTQHTHIYSTAHSPETAVRPPVLPVPGEGFTTTPNSAAARIAAVEKGLDRPMSKSAVLGVLTIAEAAILGEPSTPENHEAKQAITKRVGGLALQLGSVDKAFGIVYTTDEKGNKTPSHYTVIGGKNIGDNIRYPEDHDLPPVEKAWESHLAAQEAKQVAIEQGEKFAEAIKPTRDFMQEAEGLVASGELPHAGHRLMKVAETAVQDAKRLAKDPDIQRAFITKALMAAGAIRDMQGSDNAMKLAIATELFTQQEVQQIASFNGNICSPKMHGQPGFEEQIVGMTNHVVGRLLGEKARPLMVTAIMALGIGASITSNPARAQLYGQYESLIRKQLTQEYTGGNV